MQMSDDRVDLQGVLRGFVAAGGWYNQRVFGLQEFDMMGNGAVALEDIEIDTPLFHIPRQLILSSYASELRSKLSEEEWEDLGSGWSPLILTMMWESSRGGHSPWAYYLASLPTSFDTPMFWNDEQLLSLKGTDIENRIGREDAEREYMDRIVPVLQAHPELFPPSPYFSLASFHLQGSRILSRSFMVSKSKLFSELPENEEEEEEEEEEEQVAVMVPMADMLNAAYERDNARLFDDDEHDLDEVRGLPEGIPVGFTMISTKPIRRDEQIYNTYASPPNSELLRKYGHVDVFPLEESTLCLLSQEEIGNWPFGNPGDEVSLDGEALARAVLAVKPGSEATMEQRIDAWLEDGQDDTFYLGFSDSIERALVAFIRILLYDAEWEKFEKKGKLPQSKVDGQIYQVIARAVQDRLSRYPATLHESLESLVQNEFEDAHLRRAAVVRVGEQRLLHSTARVAEELAGGQSLKRSADEDGSSAKRQKA